MKFEDAVAHLARSGVTIPAKAIIMANDIEFAKDGTVQIWQCPNKKCPNRTYRSPTRALAIGHQKCGTDLKLIWEKDKSSLAGT